MDLRQLRYFIMTAEELHFGRAAERLHIAQPALSLQIKALEETLGVKLLARTNRVVSLTEPGRLFLKEAKLTLLQAEHATLIARRASRGELGHLDIGYDANVAYTGVLSSALRHYRQQIPDAELGLHGIHPEAQIASLLDHHIHVGFVTRPTGVLISEIDFFRLAEWPLRLALPTGHHLADRDLITLEMLSNESFISLNKSTGPGYKDYLQQVLGFKPHISYEADGAFALVSLVGSGLGIAIVPSSLSSIHVGKHVLYRPIHNVDNKICIDVVFRRNNNDAALKKFLAIIKHINFEY